jgi:ubiquinone/menaquinone biosynthesis C-methylase UbiE
MGIEIDLLAKYPKANRDLDRRVQIKSKESQGIARLFGEDFFDGDRDHGYGGFQYNPKYWKDVVSDFISHYSLTKKSRILDVGCAKGFMVYDFLQKLPGAEILGVDISDYAINNCKPEVAGYLKVGNAKELLYPDNYFDLVISINTIHNLDLVECKEALEEISRVSRGFSFITVDAYRNQDEKERMMAWNLTAKTILSVDDWISLFDEVGYQGDYYWFIP